MYLDEKLPGSGGWEGPWCRSCKQPIAEGQHLVRLYFETDPNGARDMSGPYHASCGKPFASLARALNMLSRFGR